MLVDISCGFIKYRADRNLSQNQSAVMLKLSLAMFSNMEVAIMI